MTQVSLFTEDTCQPGIEEKKRLISSAGRDVKDQSTADQRLHAAQRLAALGEMTGGIAHDFRNILTVIAAGLELAEDQCEHTDKVRIYIAGAQEGVNRGLKLTSQLLAFAKRQELGAYATDANDALRNLELFLRYGVGVGIRIVLDLGDIPKCLIDAPQFDAAILNLVVNARDAMPGGGEIKIETARLTVKAAIDGSPKPGPYVRVRIRDSGQGMTSEIVLKIFDPFFTTKGERGTGLGLAQVQAFMRQIGGFVSVTSQLGRGTTVDLFFPSVE